MTTGAVCRLCSRSLERSEPRTPASDGLTIRVPGLGIKVHKSPDLGVPDEGQDHGSTRPNGFSRRDSRPPATCSLSGTNG